MPNCSTYGQPGSNVPLADLQATTKALNCFVSGFTQAMDTISVQVFATGGKTALATINGGGSTSMTAMSTAGFTIQPGTTYYAVVTNKTKPQQTARVLYNYDTLTYGTTGYAGAVTLAVEDTPNGGDCDFNDAVVSITWTLFQS